MPLNSTRASASSTGYGQGLSNFSNVPMYELGTMVSLPTNYFPYIIEVSSDGTFLIAIGASYASSTFTFSYVAVSYSRNITTGALTFVSSLAVGTSFGSTSRPNVAIAPNNKWVYVQIANNYDSTTDTTNLIYQFSVNQTTKELTALSPAYVSVGTGVSVSRATISTDSKFLYQGCYKTNKIFIYSINSSTGGLTFSNVYTTPANTQPWWPKISNDNTYLYCSSYYSAVPPVSNGILQYQRNTVTGDLTPLSPEGLNTSGVTNILNMTPNNLFINVSCAGNTAYNFSRNPTNGTLALSSTQSGTSYFGLSYSADSAYTYGASSSSSTQVLTPSTFQGSVDPSYGNITSITNPNFVSIVPSTTNLVAAPNNDFFYAGIYTRSNSATGAIVSFQVSGTYLVPINYPTNGCALNYTLSNTSGSNQNINRLCISPDSKSVYTNGYDNTGSTGTSTNKGTQFVRDTGTGSLKYGTSISYGTQQGYGPVIVSPDNNHFYSLDTKNWAVYQYSRNTSSGNLTALGTPSVAVTSFGNNSVLNSAIFSPDGTGFYIGASFNGSSYPYIMEYTRNVSTGLLSAVGTVSIGANPGDQTPQILMAPSGNFVYGLSNAGGAGGAICIDVFSRNTSTNALTFVSRYTAASIATNHIAIGLSPNGNFLYMLNDKTVYVLSVNTSTGALVLSKTYAFTTGGAGTGSLNTQYQSLAVAPNGTAFYVGNSNGLVYQYLTNQGTGSVKSPKTYIPKTIQANLYYPPTVANGSYNTQLAVSSDSKSLYGICAYSLIQITL